MLVQLLDTGQRTRCRLFDGGRGQGSGTRLPARATAVWKETGRRVADWLAAGYETSRSSQLGRRGGLHCRRVCETGWRVDETRRVYFRTYGSGG